MSASGARIINLFSYQISPWWRFTVSEVSPDARRARKRSEGQWKILSVYSSPSLASVRANLFLPLSDTDVRQQIAERCVFKAPVASPYQLRVAEPGPTALQPSLRSGLHDRWVSVNERSFRLQAFLWCRRSPEGEVSVSEACSLARRAFLCMREQAETLTSRLHFSKET